MKTFEMYGIYKNVFEVLAYDKDGGVYDTVLITPSQALAERVAVSIQKLMNKDAYRRHDNGEPYDWAEIIDREGTRIYSKELQQAMERRYAA